MDKFDKSYYILYIFKIMLENRFTSSVPVQPYFTLKAKAGIVICV